MSCVHSLEFFMYISTGAITHESLDKHINSIHAISMCSAESCVLPTNRSYLESHKLCVPGSVMKVLLCNCSNSVFENMQTQWCAIICD